jgi:hypothetical protein
VANEDPLNTRTGEVLSADLVGGNKPPHPHGQAAVSWAAAHQVHLFFSFLCFVFAFLNLNVFWKTKIIFEVS